MRKIILILILIVFAGNAFALSGKRKNIERQTCYTASVNDGESKSFAKAYCSCVANKLDGKYTDKQLDTLVNKGYNYMINEIRPLAKKCFDKVS
tara:strand:+ start:1030 stop:1311 length:282 start_codon:yes stop_codon:yes gene_type:complete